MKKYKEDVPETFEDFAKYICNRCTANEWYCPSYCDTLEKASKIDYEILKKKFVQYDGDVQKLCRFIKKYKKRCRKRKI